jgi:hypothetical protein
MTLIHMLDIGILGLFIGIILASFYYKREGFENNNTVIEEEKVEEVIEVKEPVEEKVEEPVVIGEEKVEEEKPEEVKVEEVEDQSRDTELNRYLIRQGIGTPSIERRQMDINNDFLSKEFNEKTNELGEILQEVAETSKQQLQKVEEDYILINPDFWKNTTMSDFEKKETCMCPTINMKDQYFELDK